jgi:hypothetical protein
MKYEVPAMTRRELVLSLAAVGSQMLIPGLAGCGGSSASSGTGSSPTTPNLQPVAPGTLTPAVLTVTSSVTAPLAQGYAGLSYEKSAISRRTLTTASAGVTKLFLLLNAKSVLRVGGNSCDSTIYSPNGPGDTVNQLANSDIDLFASFVKTVNCSVIYAIGMKGFLSTPPTQTIANFVAEAVYVAKALGSSLQAFEIGNEPDLYAGYSYTQYVALWDSVASAVNTAVPGVPMSGPAIASTSNISTWTQPFSLAEKGRNLTLLTQHRYIAATGTDAALLSDAATTAGFMQALKSLAATSGMSWRLSETGSYYGATYDPVNGSVAMDFATALWVIDYLFASAANGGQGVNMHNGNLIQNSSYVPFSDDEVNTVTFVNAVYCGMLLFSMGGYGSLVSSGLSTGAAATAYAVMVDATHYSCWIVNKDQTASQSLFATIAFPSTVKSATVRVLQGTALNARAGATIQGSVVGVDGSFNPAADYTATTNGNTVTCYVPYNSAVLVQTVLA